MSEYAYQYLHETRTVFGRLWWALQSFEDLRTLSCSWQQDQMWLCDGAA